MGGTIRGRALTIVAVGCLVLDGILLLLAGLWTARSGLLVAGAGCLGAGGLIVLCWRRYVRAVADVDRARLELQAEIRALRELTGGGGSSP
jgi:hypothetical protein